MARVPHPPSLPLLCQLMTASHLLGTEHPVPERPREKEEPVVRDTSEAVDCHLGDMLQQLNSVNASKPSERGLVRQGGHCSREARESPLAKCGLAPALSS